MSRPPNAKSDLNRLIDWYAQNRPGQLFTIQINVAFCYAKKFCEVDGGTLKFRGHTILALKDTPHCDRQGLKKDRA